MPFINDMLEQNQRNQREVPSKKGISRFSFDHLEIIRHLRSQIIAQDDTFLEIEKILKVIQAGITNPQKPLGVFLLIGPTGVGKTQTIRLIAQCIHHSLDGFCRIDMNTLSQEHYSASLTGAPPGYVGSKEGHTLFEIPLIEGSYSKPGIVLFDEIEKANPQVIRSILNIIDNGKMTLTSGNRSIDFKNSLIFMTSNLGSKKLAIFQNSFLYKLWNFFGFKHSKKENKILKSSLEAFFDPEFLNRIDTILYYKKIPTNAIKQIIQLELDQLNELLQNKELKISLSENAIEMLQKSYDPRYGARDIARKFTTHIKPLVAEWIFCNPSGSGRIGIDFKNNRFILEIGENSIK
ncbi:AAA family ATPase [Helicobacter sp. 11S02596-1]|uniref:AAA family ATPase n=1 Tax=Helicobacter sp. 11S02596-1 TaxID=1476194 RepID=UPI000BA76CF8|nr:AAA family ATPase [Helicobacter sp. 11S02596-1]PAF43228.1 hypothetical protein BJI48_05665 [Helicobacter sp. 11S02596-1]